MSIRSNDEIILLKIGGSSITNKSEPETLNRAALQWLVSTIKNGMIDDHNNKNGSASAANSNRRKRYIVVHGAGSFGHHTAKSYGLKGITAFPPKQSSSSQHVSENYDSDRQQKLLGLGRTRISVQKLNQQIVTAFLDEDIPAVAISPCFGAIHPTSTRNNNNEIPTTAPQHQQLYLQSIVESTILDGLVPVLHGDAGLFHDSSSCVGVGLPAILSGDIIMQMIGTAKFVSHVVFITDVDGVYTSDPRNHPTAQLLRTLHVDPLTSDVITTADSVTFAATESSHSHDVTGGLKTKINAAIQIAASGKRVYIVRSETISAERALLLKADSEIERATILVPTSRGEQ